MSFDKRVSHVLLPFRFVPFTNPKQAEPTHPHYKSLVQPTKKEVKYLEQLIKIVARSEGSLDPSKVEWSFVQNTHPDAGNPLVRTKSTSLPFLSLNNSCLALKL